MTSRILSALTLICLGGLLLEAQQSRIEGPVSGYVFDATAQALRPILGVPGASLFGAPMDLGFAAASAYVAPRQDAVLAVAADRTLHVFRFAAGTATEQKVDNLASAPERVAFSPSGTSVALFAGGSIEVVNGLPDNPAVAGGVDLPTGTKLDALAVSDDGKALLISAGNAVRVFSSFADLGQLMETAGPAMLAFAAGGHDAAIADPAGAGIVLFRDLTGARVSQVLAPTDDTIGAASAVAFAADGKKLLLASSTGQSVVTFDLEAGARDAIACSCSPSTLARMGNLFRLTDLGSDPLWLLDARSSESRIVFVPALAQ